MNCNEAGAMIAAYADGEVDGLRGHTVRKHLRLCRDCAAKHQELLGLRARIRAEAPHYKAPAALRDRVMALVESARLLMRTCHSSHGKLRCPPFTRR